jgi:hypothetical protein
LNIFKLEIVKKERQLAFLTKKEFSCIRQVFQAFLTSMELQKSIRYGSFLVWTGRLAKSRQRTRLDESGCVELVVVVDWDNDINDAIIAVKTDAGLDLFDNINDAIVAVKTDTRLNCFDGIMGSFPICKSLFFMTNLPGVALTGVTWLVVALYVVFVMMGE